MNLDTQALELARTHSYTLGMPRNFTLNDDAAYIYFTRSDSGTSNVNSLWRLEISSGSEQLVFDPLTHRADTQLTPEEERQRERLRETSMGITSYTSSKDGKLLCFTYNGSLWLINTRTLQAEQFAHVSSAFDPRFSFDSSHIAFVNHEGLWAVASHSDAEPKLLVANESETIFWGRAEFAASEEFERYRGYWWSPDSLDLLAARVDETAVHDAYAVSENSLETPHSFKYPAAGTPNAVVSLFRLHLNSSERQEIVWDKTALPYLTNVQWRTNDIYISLQSRGQRRLQLHKVIEDNATVSVHDIEDKVWVDILQPLPYADSDGHIISLTSQEKRRISYDGAAITPTDHHVDDFIGTCGDWVVYTASPDPKERVVFAQHISSNKNLQLSPAGGLFSALISNDLIFITGAVMAGGTRQYLLQSGATGKPQALRITSHAAAPKSWPEPRFFTVGTEKLQASLVLPANHAAGTKLPVILQVYGGPHHQEVMFSSRSYLESQWWADQGYAVLSVDGPGTPGRDLQWERQIHSDLITEVAAAQITALHDALVQFPDLDGSRVGVRGWSFGGYLSAFLSVLYPHDIHASISGAPVTEWRLYDTHYTERYLGNPDEQAQAYDKSSLLKAASKAYRPIMLIHGLSDDNVLPGNSLELLRILGEHNCPYQFVPLSGASHFTKQAEQRAWLLQMELAFVNQSLQVLA